MKNKNKGFTLVELVIVVAIFTILLGILEPSVNSIFGFRVQRAANSIGAALDKTKTEAMNRLVGEMKLEKQDDGYYISYYLDRGKASEGRVKQDQPEKIAPAGTKIKSIQRIMRQAKKWNQEILLSLLMTGRVEVSARCNRML